jgi:hypothetical protein
MNPNEPAKEVTLQLLLQAQSSTTEAVKALASSTSQAQLGGVASTTEAIYALGYSLQLFLGLFVFLIFLYMGAKFMARYL